MQFIKTVLCLTLVALAASGCAAVHNVFHKEEVTAVRIHEQVDAATPPQYSSVADIPQANLKLTISLFPTLSENNVLSAALYDTAGGKAILLRFDIHDECTTRNRGRYLVTIIDNHPVAAWLVDHRIENGQFLVEGDFTDEEAKRVVDILNKMAKKTHQ